MNIFLYSLIINTFSHVFAETIIINNLKLNQLEHSDQVRIYNSRNLNRNRRAVYYQTYQFPSTQNHFSASNKVSAKTDYKSNGDASKGYEIIKLTANENPFTPPNQPKHDIQFSSIEFRNPNGRSLSRSSPRHYFNTHSNSKEYFSNPNIPNYHSPSIGIRFGSDEEDQPSNSHNKAEYNQGYNNNNKTRGSETFQYQFNKGWSVHEAVSVDEIVIPHLEQHKGSRYSTPNAPEARFYQKFYDIYKHVEHQTQQNLGKLEKQSINDDFNGRSIVAPGQYPHMVNMQMLIRFYLNLTGLVKQKF